MPTHLLSVAIITENYLPYRKKEKPNPKGKAPGLGEKEVRQLQLILCRITLYETHTVLIATITTPRCIQ